MSDTPTDVFVGGYPDIDAATKDFDALAKLVEDKKVKIEAAILITHAEDGIGERGSRRPTIAAARESSGAARVGVLVGLAAPPLLAATAAGAAAGGLVGKFVDKRVETEMHDKIGENLPPGTAGIIAVFDDDAAARRRAGAAGRAREVDRPDGQEGHEGAQGRSRGGDGQVRPRPHGAADPGQELRRHDRPDDRPVGPRLDDHPRPEGAGGRAERPAHPHRRRRASGSRTRSAGPSRRRT